jgi:methyl-accepting chemotaxis protein
MNYKQPQPEVQTSHIERMLRQMERSSRRWEKMVFPALIAFLLLAGYGFFMIYSMTRDMSIIAQTIEIDFRKDVEHIRKDISEMVAQVGKMQNTMAAISVKMDPLQDFGPLLAEIKELDDSVGRISGSVDNMDQSVVSMNDSMTNLDDSMYYMGRDVGDMNDSFSSPTKMFKRMMPW